jgi:hypothetical protein
MAIQPEVNMIKPLIYLTSFFFILASLSSCGSQVNDDKRSEVGPEGFSLTFPNTQLDKSNFCGDTPPKVIADDPTPSHRFDPELLASKLSGKGLNGWMHGVVVPYDHFVLAYRSEDPDDFMAFFKSEQFSLVPANEKIAGVLAGLHRHDKVVVNGVLLPNAGPLRHVLVTKLTVTKPFEFPTENTYNTSALTKLGERDQFEIFGKLHAMVLTPVS